MSAGTNVLLCPQNRGPAPTLSYFFRSTWSAAAALGSSSLPPRPPPRPRLPSSSSSRARAAPVVRRPGASSPAASPTRSLPPPPRLLEVVLASPFAPAPRPHRHRARPASCPRAASTSPSLGPRRRAPRHRPGPAAARLLDLVQSALPPFLVPIDALAKVHLNFDKIARDHNQVCSQIQTIFR